MPQGRRVRRVIRHIDTWSVLKVAVLFFASFTLVLLLAGILLWAAGSMLGAIDSVEDFMRAIGFEDFEFVGTQLLRGFVAAGLVVVVLGSGMAVLVAVVYNLISDMVGGIQLTVLEEEPRRPPPAVVPLATANADREAANGSGGATSADTNAVRSSS